jgi:ElaA protein
MIDFNIHAFNELYIDQFYEIISLRNEIFVVEQACIYQDADGKDKQALHVTGVIDNQIVAVARILPPGISYNEVSIGRVAVSKKYRNKGLGKILMKYCITKCVELFPQKNITISAQEYLQEFYEKLGFVKMSATYHEDGIPHIKMTFFI